MFKYYNLMNIAFQINIVFQIVDFSSCGKIKYNAHFK